MSELNFDDSDDEIVEATSQSSNSEAGSYYSDRNLSKRRLEYIIEKGDANHKYVKKWLSQPWMQKIRTDPNFSSWMNLTGLGKELTESWSAFKQIKKLLKIARQHRDIDERQLVFFDICSGKGILSTLLSFSFPKCTVYMLDKNGKMRNDHLASQPNVRFEKINVKDPHFKSLIESRAQGRFAIFLGIHLCGFLSEVFIDLYNEISDAQMMVLSPCCFNKKREHVLEEARATQWTPYHLWTRELYSYVKSNRKEALVDEEMQSDKNNFVISVKDSMIPEEDTTTLKGPLPPHILGDVTYRINIANSNNSQDTSISK